MVGLKPAILPRFFYNFSMRASNYIRFILFTASLLPFTILAQNNNCALKLHIDSLNSQATAYLQIENKIDTVNLVNGVAEFSIALVRPIRGIVTIKYENETRKTDAKYIYLQPGEIRLNINSPKNTIFQAWLTGPQLTRDFEYKLLNPVIQYNEATARIGKELQQAKAQQGDTVRLTKELEQNIENCFLVPQTYIQSNPASPLSLVALSMLGNGGKGSPISLSGLDSLFNSLTIDIKTSPDGIAYAERLSDLKWKYDAELKSRNGITDGPYVFYAKGTVYVKSVMLNNDNPRTTLDSFKIAEKHQHLLQIHLDQHPEWDFTVKLNDNNLSRTAIFKGADKLLVLSDIEGEFEPFRNLLLAAKVIDEKYNWTFGKGKLIVAGDLFDRGRQVCQFLWLLYKLEDEARAKGGDVNVILGNHDIMNLSGDFRYVDPVYQTDANLMNETYASLYVSGSELGQWLRSKNIIEKVGDFLVTHGGISQVINNLHLPLDSINTRCRPFYTLANRLDKITDKPMLPYFSGKDSPFWYRGYFMEPKATQAQVDSTLSIYKAKKIIVGHDIIDHVHSFYQGKVIGVDVNEHENSHEALLIIKDKYYRIDDKGNRTAL